MKIKPRLLSLMAMGMMLVGCSSMTSKQPPPSKQLQNDRYLPRGAIIPVSDTIPHPSEMRVNVVTHGRVSTLKSVEVVKVGKQIPYTYSWGRVNNTPGFDWYVSKHFALKSDRPEEQVLLYLELLEMSFPHYIELFGITPPDLENKRMAAVYGSSKEDTKVFVPDDNITRGISAGGEAMFFNLVGYSFPSAREQHQRYIVIHEQGHVFQMSLMDYTGWLPGWFTEGTADALAHHYYDPKKKQLKVMVFDRASPMDYIRLGLKQYEELNKPSIQAMTNNPGLYRGINFLIVHFMLNDPDRSHKFKAYRDEMALMRESEYGGGKALSHQLLVDIFGDWDKVEQAFARFVASIDKTFNIAGGPWEQDGNQLWVRVLNNNYEHGMPRVDVHLTPKSQPFFSQFKFDQPVAPLSPLVLKPARGVEHPILSLEIDYVRDHLRRGRAGIGLGLKVTDVNKARLEADKKVGSFEQKSYQPDEDELLKIMIVKGDTLVVDGTSLGASEIKYSLPPGLVRELALQRNPKLGLSVTIERDQLAILLKSEGQMRKEYFPISPAVREKLMQRHMAILAEGAEHRVTAFYDEGRNLNPVPRDLASNGEVNPWANPADRSISRLFRAIWRLGDKAPKQLSVLYQHMLEATPKDRDTQMASLNRFNREVPSLVSAIVNSGASREKINRALVELSGLHLRLEWRREKANGEQLVSAVLRNQGVSPVSAKVSLTQTGNNSHFKNVSLNGGEKVSLDLKTTPETRKSNNKITANAFVDWEGLRIALEDEQDARVYPWSSMAIIEEAKIVGNDVTITSELRGPHAGETKGKLMVQAYPSDLFEEAYFEEDVSIEPYEIHRFKNKLKLKSGVSKRPYAVDVSFKLVIDGEPVLLTKRSEIK